HGGPVAERVVVERGQPAHLTHVLLGSGTTEASGCPQLPAALLGGLGGGLGPAGGLRGLFRRQAGLVVHGHVLVAVAAVLDRCGPAPTHPALLSAGGRRADRGGGRRRLGAVTLVVRGPDAFFGIAIVHGVGDHL